MATVVRDYIYNINTTLLPSTKESTNAKINESMKKMKQRLRAGEGRHKKDASVHHETRTRSPEKTFPPLEVGLGAERMTGGTEGCPRSLKAAAPTPPPHPRRLLLRPYSLQLPPTSLWTAMAMAPEGHRPISTSRTWRGGRASFLCMVDVWGGVPIGREDVREGGGGTREGERNSWYDFCVHGGRVRRNASI